MIALVINGAALVVVIWAILVIYHDAKMREMMDAAYREERRHDA